VPFTDDGRQRLAVELERAHRSVDPPALVWLFDSEQLREVRASAYATRDGAPRRVLVVWHEPGGVDRVEWVCEPFIRARRE
jgi:hypothetical protein